MGLQEVQAMSAKKIPKCPICGAKCAVDCMGRVSCSRSAESGCGYYGVPLCTHRAICRALAAKAKPKGSCRWREDEDGVWATSCGQAWEFTDGGPAANRVRYCYHCGRVVMEAKP